MRTILKLWPIGLILTLNALGIFFPNIAQGVCIGTVLAILGIATYEILKACHENT